MKKEVEGFIHDKSEGDEEEEPSLIETGIVKLTR